MAREGVGALLRGVTSRDGGNDLSESAASAPVAGVSVEVLQHANLEDLPLPGRVERPEYLLELSFSDVLHHFREGLALAQIDRVHHAEIFAGRNVRVVDDRADEFQLAGFRAHDTDGDDDVSEVLFHFD